MYMLTIMEKSERLQRVEQRVRRLQHALSSRAIASPQLELIV